MKKFRICYSIRGVKTLVATYIVIEAESHEVLDAMTYEEIIDRVFEEKPLAKMKGKEAITIYRKKEH